jgi:hypothetical protein
VGGATYPLVGPPHPTPLPPASGGRGVKGRVVRATLPRQIFEQPVVTLSPDSLAPGGEGRVGASLAIVMATASPPIQTIGIVLVVARTARATGW